MWKRKELKARGKAAFHANYLRCVIVGIVLAVFVLATGSATIKQGVSTGMENIEIEISESDQELQGSLESLQEQLEDLSEDEALALVLAIVGIVLIACLIAAVIATIIDVFIINPLEVGCLHFFLVNSGEPAKLGEMCSGFKNRYFNTVMTIFLRDLYLWLWTALFFIPGIVKSYSYRMVPYIVSENPDMKPKDVITLSRRMMNGQKWNAFVLDLSFFGWYLLSFITFGLVSTFYAFPYQCATNAELYKAIRDEYSAAAV